MFWRAKNGGATSDPGIKALLPGNQPLDDRHMTPKEEQWLAEYHRQEAQKQAKRGYLALGCWCLLAIAWLICLFTAPDRKFSFTDSLFLITIIINCAAAVKQVMKGRRIAAGRKSTTGTGPHPTNNLH